MLNYKSGLNKRHVFWPCDICGKKLTSIKNRKQHLKNEHGVGSLTKNQMRLFAIKRQKGSVRAAKKSRRSKAGIDFDLRNQAIGALPDGHTPGSNLRKITKNTRRK